MVLVFLPPVRSHARARQADPRRESSVMKCRGRGWTSTMTKRWQHICVLAVFNEVTDGAYLKKKKKM